jgi:ferredoxin-NADP reductase
MSSSYEVEFLGREECGADVISARFSRPPGFGFLAGQWMVLTLPSVEQRLAETFTICSAPGDDYLEITTRLSGSAYKNALAALSPGEQAVVVGPGGRLTLPSDPVKLVFLVGGVGITPARSMLRDAAATGRVFDDAVLFYGNRDASCVPFEVEFAAMSEIGLRTVLCYEHPPEGWGGESGFITAEMVRRHLPSTDTGRKFIVAGPPAMVEAMEVVLDRLSVPIDNRLVERFGPVVPPHRQVAQDTTG